MSTLINNIRSGIEDAYKQQFGTKPPKYFKYMMIAFSGTSLLIFRKIFWTLLNKLRSYPHGPIGLPFLGCIIPFSATPFKFLINIGYNYGPITYVPLLASNNIFISDPKLLRKLYQREKIIARPEWHIRPTPAFTDITSIKESLQRRKYASTTVFNLTNTSFVLEKTKQCLDQYIEPLFNEDYIENNRLWYPRNFMHFFALNTVFSATFDYILPFNDPFIKKYSLWGDELVQAAGPAIAADLLHNFTISYPKWLQNKLSYNTVNKGENMLIEWMENNGFMVNVNENILKRTTSAANKKNKVYIDYLINKIDENEINVKKALSDVGMIMAGGVDTTAKSIEYGFLLLAKYPDTQEMIYKELVEVMRKNNLKEFNFNILKQLHVFRAFIYDVLRISCVAPSGLPHMSLDDHIVDIDGKKMVIPKYTICHQNTYFMHKYLDWNDGNKILKKENNDIHLEYWLKDDGGNGNKKFKMNDNFILFGVGKRECVGMSLAMKSIFAVFGLLMAKYKFKAKNNDPNGMDIKQEWGLTLTVEPPVGIIVEKR